jgi:hypothetical protein
MNSWGCGMSSVARGALGEYSVAGPEESETGSCFPACGRTDGVDRYPILHQQETPFSADEVRGDS